MDDEKTRMYEILKDMQKEKLIEMFNACESREEIRRKLINEYSALSFALVMIESEGIT